MISDNTSELVSPPCSQGGEQGVSKGTTNNEQVTLNNLTV
jgi:hypothetical protein